MSSGEWGGAKTSKCGRGGPDEYRGKSQKRKKKREMAINFGVGRSLLRS